MRHNPRLWETACAIALALVLLASCASTDLTSSQRNPAYTGPALTRIMVIGVTANLNGRQEFENEFVAKLKAAGVSAVPSYPLIPDSASAGAAGLRKAAESAGVDGILAARLVSLQQQDPNALQAINFEDRTVSFYAYYASQPSGSYDPSLANDSDTITVHIDLYSVTASRLAWAGDAAIFPSANVKAATPGLASTVIRTLKDQKLI